jgi:hypothetical protein
MKSLSAALISVYFAASPIPYDDATVEFINKTRGGDRVVSAKDDALGLPGGVKKLDLEVIPRGEVATLIIKRTKGISGSAVFEDTGSATTVVTGTKTIEVLGRDVSDEPRNMEIEASVRGAVKARWSFTVFRVDPTAFVSGNVDEILPPTALTYGGYGRGPFSHPSMRQSLAHMYKGQTKDSADLGHKHIEGSIAYGGIVIRSQIFPSGMDRHDFNLIHSRAEAFDWDRKISERQYNENGCLITGGDCKSCQKDDENDDGTEREEDNLPDNDGTSGELFIWTTDMPLERRLIRLNPERPFLGQGQIKRVRIQFVEQAKYAGVKVSNAVPWYWRSSQENRAGAGDFIQNNDIKGDNELSANATTPLTFDLVPATSSSFAVTGFVPAAVNEGDRNVGGEVTGLKLDTGDPCLPHIHIMRESSTDVDRTKDIIRFGLRLATTTRLSGTFSADVPPGAYTVKVFIGEEVRTAPNQLSVIKTP